jgi:vacuolar-type H+-ATPase subunit H
MEIVTGQESTELVDAAVRGDETGLAHDRPEQTPAGLELISEQLLRIRRRRERVRLPEPKSTWVWDRTRQAWMEIIEKPAPDILPGGNGSRGPDSPLLQEPSALPAGLPRRAPSRMPAFRLRTIKSSLARMLDVLIMRTKSAQPHTPRAATTELVERHDAGTAINGKREAEDLAAIIVARAAGDARQTLVEARDRARELRERAEREADRRSLDKIATAEQLSQNIVKATEEQAEARAETIVARAEEQTKAQADKLISQALVTAEAAVASVIADASEKSRARAERIVSQAIERAEAEARAIVAKAEERARAQAERIAAATDDACRKRLALAEVQARRLVEAAEDQARKVSASPSVPTPLPARAIPQQVPDRVPQQAPLAVHGQAQSEPAQLPQRKPQAIAEGSAELVIKHPVNIGRMQKMLSRLARYPEIRVIDLAGSPGKGVRIKLYSFRLGRLPSVLEALPEVEEVAELPVKASKICPGQRVCPGLGNTPPAMRLLVTLAPRGAILDL